MTNSRLVVASVLVLGSIGLAQQTEINVQSGTFVPAGTLLHCTLDEPNFLQQPPRSVILFFAELHQLKCSGNLSSPAVPICLHAWKNLRILDTSSEREGFNWSLRA